ncbi:signal peptidase I [Dehalobacterium formicoaceticum]|uniref:Signal peptidase I n=1 Tax=Dehalobacterium formicoaceticum TaxID=51515 RepID=A0ABT1Y5T1_9FIRM|nr:signal peptidase I [Dehalobacterium formicoaceticum]MCR6546244.1 signal peptidase I [Dehalobacterium formicoaceticum]
MEKLSSSFFQGLKGSWGEIVEALSLAVILAILMRLFLWEPYFIPSSSMEPVLQPGDRILVNKWIYRFRDPKRGDIIIFRYPMDERIQYIKRIIALPGEVIQGRNGEILINGQVLEESYISEAGTAFDFGPITMDEGAYFVLGDHRDNSRDSRVFGIVTRDKILGKASITYWPFNRVTSLP